MSEDERRAETARALIQTTTLPFAEVAFASGFTSVRRFNDTIRRAYGATPTTLRRDGPPARPREWPVAPSWPIADGTEPPAGTTTPISLRLATRAPFAGPEVLRFLAVRAVAGVEAAGNDGSYRRVLELPHGPAVVTLSPALEHVVARFALTDSLDLGPAVELCRRLLDLDADPEAIDTLLGADPWLGPLVAAVPGRRSPGAVDGAELLVRAILGQQISVSAARTVAGGLVASLGRALPEPLAMAAGSALTHRFPTAEAIAGLDPADLPMPRARGRALVAALSRVADGSLVLDPGSDRDQVEAGLLAVGGVGAWTASYVVMRALGDPDVFLPTDLAVRRGLRAVGGPADARGAAEAARAWRPWRSYALHHLWPAGAPG